MHDKPGDQCMINYVISACKGLLTALLFFTEISAHYCGGSRETEGTVSFERASSLDGYTHSCGM